jgi:hypothetical protein
MALAVGAASAALLAVWRARFAAVAVLIVTVVFAHWVGVLRTLPDYERYKHVPQFARVIQERASPAAEVCTYKLATPSLVYSLRRHVTFVEDEASLLRLLGTKAELYCLMREEDYEAVRTAPGVHLTRIAQAPVFYTQLQDFWSRPAPRRVVLVTSRVSGGP